MTAEQGFGDCRGDTRGRGGPRSEGVREVMGLRECLPVAPV